MVYEERASEWYKRALQEKDEFIKFQLLFISLEVLSKLKKFKNLRDIKQDNSIKTKFYSKMDLRYLEELKQNLDIEPHKNENPDGDHRWSGKLNSEHDFEGIIEFIIRSRNNLFHGDKELSEPRDKFIVKHGCKILQPLVEAIIA